MNGRLSLLCCKECSAVPTLTAKLESELRLLSRRARFLSYPFIKVTIRIALDALEHSLSRSC
jgi:hypothetical protein